MVLQFNPPQDLINAYLNRPSPGQIASEGINQALQTYASAKAAQQKQAIDQQDRDLRMAQAISGPNGGGQDVLDVLAKITASRNAPQTPTAQGPSLIDRWKAKFGMSPVGKSPDMTQPPTPSTGTVSGMPPGYPPMASDTATPTTPVSSPTTDPLVQEYQKDPIAFKRQHGEAGIAKLKTQAEVDKLLTSKPEDKYYTGDQTRSLLKDNPNVDAMIASFPKDQVPRDAVHLMMTSGSQNLNVGTKESNQQDKLEQQYRQSFQSIRGDPSLKRTEEQRDAAATAYNRIQEVKDHGQVLNPIDYVDILGQVYKARTGSAPTNEVLQQARQATAKGQFGKAFTYITGEQAPATTQDIQDTLQKMALSMGQQADKFHDGYMKSRIKPPLGLAHDRVANVNSERGMSFAEATGLNQQEGGSLDSTPVIEGGYSYTPGPGGRGNKTNWKKQ